MIEFSDVQRGIQLFELGRYQDASNYFRENLENWTNRYYLALCYYNLDEYDKAIDLSDTLLEEEPDNDAVFYLKASIAAANSEEKKALSFISQAIEIDPYNDDYFGLKAAILLSLKKYDKGLEMANEGLRLNANSGLCLNMRAQLLTKMKRVDEAENTIEDILLDNPEDAYSHANVGWIALENNNVQKALSHFKEALQKDPNFEYAREGMSTALKSKNFIYRNYLKYSFWISKQSSGKQWGILIGIYLIYRFSYNFLSASGMSYLAIPLLIAYLLFALGSWIMEPMSNMILGFDTYGKYLLNEDEKKSGLTFGALILLGILSITIYYSTVIDHFLPLAVASFSALIPLPRAFLQNSKRGKNIGISVGSFILTIGLVGLFVVPNPFAVSAAAFLVMIAFTWLGNLFE